MLKRHAVLQAVSALVFGAVFAGCASAPDTYDNTSAAAQAVTGNDEYGIITVSGGEYWTGSQYNQRYILEVTVSGLVYGENTCYYDSVSEDFGWPGTKGYTFYSPLWVWADGITISFTLDTGSYLCNFSGNATGKEVAYAGSSDCAVY
jgi:hypothetical protein